MLVVTSAHLDYVLARGLSPDTLQWTATNVHCVNRLVSIPETRYRDEALMGILSALNVDILAGSGMNVGIHSRGLAKLPRHRGSLQSLRGSQSTDLLGVSYWSRQLVKSKGHIWITLRQMKR
jgi:hypothetical protein